MYIGIDLGTSNSVIAGLIDGEATVFRPVDGSDILPSVIYFDKRGHRLYGRRAYDQAMLAPDSVAMGFKRLMGTSTPISIPATNMSLTPEECSAEIIRQLLGQAATATGGAEIEGAVITIPAAFNQMQSEATMRAAQMAGLQNIELLQEPVAAAIAAMGGAAKRSGQFLIYDLGGGTFDLALAQSLQGEVSIIAHQGINMLGGRDFDRMLVNEVVRPWLAENFDLPENFQRDPQYRRLVRISHLAAEKAKIELSNAPEATVFASDEELRLQDASGTDVYLEVLVTRKRYEELIREPIDQTIAVARQVLEENNYTNENIDRVVFVGGPSRTPLVREIVSHELGIPTDMKLDPLTAVAVGAAWYCESREWNAEGKVTSKPVKASVDVEAETAINLHFDYPLRTGNDAEKLKVRITGSTGEAEQIQVEGQDGWASDFLELTDGLVIDLPVRQMGENRFAIRLFDGQDRQLDMHDHDFTITRTVATTAAIPASQTIAVKALKELQGESNILYPLVEKATMLPAEGKTTFKSARDLQAGDPAHLGFELFQVEYPDKVELNLCVGVFRIAGGDLPEGYAIKAGDPIVFNWRMSDSGLLQASVSLPGSAGGKGGGIELQTPRFYSPQAGQVSFDNDHGRKFAEALMGQAEEECGDIAAALGPDGGADLGELRARLKRQQEALKDASEPEALRKVCEEIRFVRQDTARLGKQHRAAMLQRQLGKLTMVFYRAGRAHADENEKARFENHASKTQKVIDDTENPAFEDAERHIGEMREIFFAAAWRDPEYVKMWFNRLAGEPYLFPDQEEFKKMIAEGGTLMGKGDIEGLRPLVSRLLDSRVALTASDATGELATIVKA
ncbi:MAG: Hsp70 family protein [Alphaproteobacteria bacterium]|nr:Hsp70 family protein [Alphaproteobacteria bacterium]